jgi:hypothetical protein
MTLSSSESKEMEVEGMEKFLAPCPWKMRSGGAAHRLRASVVLRQSSDEVKGLQWRKVLRLLHGMLRCQVSHGEVA